MGGAGNRTSRGGKGALAIVLSEAQNDAGIQTSDSCIPPPATPLALPSNRPPNSPLDCAAAGERNCFTKIT